MSPLAFHAAGMVCSRCGTTFEGRFCPNCGTPAPVVAPAATGTSASSPPAPPAAPPPVTFRCGRCGTIYSGKFCPACGLPAWSPWIPPPIPRGPPAGFVLLNVAWVFSLLAFLVILAIATVGMFAMLSPIATGIDDIRQGATVDPSFDTTTAWTFSPWTPIGATGSLQGSGGNPGGYGEIQLEGRPGSTVRGYWSQAFTTDGSHPYLAAVRFDYRVLQPSSILQSLTIAMYVERSNGTPPAQGGDAWNVTLAQTT